MIEAEFHKAIADRDATAPHPRFAIYRNNVAAALATALEVRYPVTAQLVGAEFFRGMANVFSAGEKPQSPVLIDYGAALPDFIAGFPPAMAVPYLADVARLESLWWQAYHAADATPLGLDRLTNIPPETLQDVRLLLHPSAGLMASPFAVADIWMAHNGGPGMRDIRIGKPQSVVVARPAATVEIRAVPADSFAFLCCLARGEALADAVERTGMNHPGFDIPAQLAAVFNLGLITGLSS